MAYPLPVDRGYLTLLAHLRQSKPRISPETLQAAICHYLIHLPPAQPTPTPLTASVIASSVWHPLSLTRCLALSNTFRIAMREKFSELKKEKRGLFDTSLSSDLASWSRSILVGLKGGDALLCLAISGGLHLGIGDLQDVKLSQRLCRNVEETMVLAFAEATEDAAASANDPWAYEFNQKDTSSQEKVELSVLLASQYFNSISKEPLSALNLLSLASSCLAAIEHGFASGNYLHDARDSLYKDGNGAITLSPELGPENAIDVLLGSECFTWTAYLCRLLARVISVLCDTSSRSRSKPKELWELLNTIALKLHEMACRVEEYWRSSLLVEVQSESQLGDRAQKMTEKIWAILKTHLFSSLMLQQAILDTILFMSPPSSSLATKNAYSTSYLTSSILQTLSSLSFVIASFGGVTAGSTEGSKGPAFPELKKVFYVSIDILSTDEMESASFIRGLIREIDSCRPNAIRGSPFINAKRSFVLACIEQFISVLDDTCIEAVVLPFCEPHLGDPSHIQTYELAHSVMLSIFAAHAEGSTAPSSSQHSESDWKGKSVDSPSDVNIARRLVPGYAQTLLENAREGGLTTPQLRLAYAALVRSANTGKNQHTDSVRKLPTASTSFLSRWTNNSDEDYEGSGNPALAWLCIEQLLQALSSTSNGDPQTHFALSLTLISLISNVSLLLLPRVLKEVKMVIESGGEAARRQILLENVFEEMLERVGDAEREVAMKWWFECSKKWEASGESRTREQELT